MDVETGGLAGRAIALGVGMGLWVALVFALFPLLAVRRVPPLAALRRDYEPEPSPARPLALAGVRRARGEHGRARGAPGGKSAAQGAIFAGGVAVALLVLWARVLGCWSAPRAAGFPAGWPYLWRQGLSNLHRPSNQTVTVVLAIGFGAFLLGTLVLVQHNLLQQLRLTGGPARPNLVLFDIQPDQLSAVRARARATPGSRPPRPVPIVPMRIASVKGRPVRALLADTDRRQGGPARHAWAFRREYRSTYRDTLVASERLVGGRVVDPGAAGARRRISVETRPGRRSSASAWATRSCGTCRGSRSRPAWPACARWTGRGSSRTSSSSSSPARWRARRTRW